VEDGAGAHAHPAFVLLHDAFAYPQNPSRSLFVLCGEEGLEELAAIFQRIAHTLSNQLGKRNVSSELRSHFPQAIISDFQP
jgi:hypothetical protein